MKTLPLVVAAAVVGVALTVLLPAPAPLHAEGELYTCGMHPEVIQEGPGSCPICGMDLTPLRKGPTPGPTSSPTTGPAGEGAAAADPPGSVRIDPVVVQNMGVRVAHVQRGSVFRHIRTIGEVEVAEDEISVVNPRFSGWIERIWADETGQEVRKGQALFRIYSPEVIAAQEELLLAVNTQGRQSPLAKASERRLRLWEIPSGHIDEVLEAGNGQLTLTVRSPRAGYVLHKNAILGARVQAGADLYRIGNLRKIWVNAEVYEFDAPWVEVGQQASMELSFQQGQAWKGEVSYIHPTLNPKSRTLRVRLEFENPGLNLKPGMFATVRIKAQERPAAIIVPTEAVMHSGERRLLFVSPGVGRYEPREVVTGLAGDNRMTEILSGVQVGEVVVVSGQFLLDSESQLQEAVGKLIAERLQVQGASAKPSWEGGQGGHVHPGSQGPAGQHGEAYWTCPMHPQIVQDGPGACPICGMDLVQKRH